jgi:hypothetical protein
MPYRAPIIGTVWVIPIRIVTVIPVATPDIGWTGIWPHRWPYIGWPPPVYIYIPAVINIDINIITPTVNVCIPVTRGRLVLFNV